MRACYDLFGLQGKSLFLKATQEKVARLSCRGYNVLLMPLGIKFKFQILVEIQGLRCTFGVG